MIYFVDTNVFLDLIVREGGVRFKESKLFLDKVKRGEIKAMTSNLVLAEVVWVLSSFYKMERGEISRAVTTIIGISSLKYIEKVDWNSALRLFGDSCAKFVDCMVASVKQVKNRKWVVISYDRDFDKLGVKRMEPGDVLKNFVK